MKLKVRTISIGITILTYVVLAVFIVVSVNFYTKPLKSGPFHFPTISELIDDRPENGFIYIIFITVYGSIKTILTLLSLLDAKVLHAELIEKEKGITETTELSRSFFVLVSMATGVLAGVQIFCMVILVFFPISKAYHAHVIVAALAFGSALTKSFFLLVRRKLLYDISSTFYLANVVYYLSFLGTFFAFYYTRYGYVEYILVFLILFENFFLAVEFYHLIIPFSLAIEDNEGETEIIRTPFERAALLDRWLAEGI